MIHSIARDDVMCTDFLFLRSQYVYTVHAYGTKMHKEIFFVMKIKEKQKQNNKKKLQTKTISLWLLLYYYCCGKYILWQML